MTDEIISGADILGGYRDGAPVLAVVVRLPSRH